ncbi:MAG: low molecular weight phosphotyrosine protein phosphatase [Clostridiales bacterium]|nr:low molecular weight phosphotyrosine protein phosphatase [Clostridiales bacterium]
MINVIFVCHGNICRSPMGEFIFKDMVKKRGLEGCFYIDLAATSREELGNPVYPPAARKLRSIGIDCRGHRARQFTLSDYRRFDYVLVMERYNTRNLNRIIGGDSDNKVHRLLDFSSRPRDIADPWYTDDFDTACREITEGCESFLSYLEEKGEI